MRTNKSMIWFLIIFSGLLMAQVPVSQPNMDPLSAFVALGINFALIVALIATTSVIKAFVPEKWNKFIVFIPMVLACAYVFAFGVYADLGQKVLMAFLHAGAAGYVYNLLGGLAKKAEAGLNKAVDKFMA